MLREGPGHGGAGTTITVAQLFMLEPAALAVAQIETPLDPALPSTRPVESTVAIVLSAVVHCTAYSLPVGTAVTVALR